jgi:pyruvate,water dikinase
VAAKGTRVELPADFPVEFADPSDADESWERDDMHLPFALTPLAGDQVRYILGASFNRYYEHFGMARRGAAAVWNGWAYFSFRANVPEDQEKAQTAAFVELARARTPLTTAYWRDDALPALRAIYAAADSVDTEGLSGEALAAAWLDAWEGMLEAWKIHFIAILGPYQVLEDLSDAYAAAMGAGRDAEALTLTGGAHHELEEVEAGIERLAAAVAASPALGLAVAAAAESPLGDDPDDPIAPERDAILAAPGGRAFADDLAAFLDEHGHLGHNHDDLRYASWGENPRLLLGQIATRARNPAQPSAEREAAQARHAAELEARARAALAERPDELARFEMTLAHAREIGYLTEGHNYWIDRMSHARTRALALRVGARLRRDGVVARAGDVFFLHRDEIVEALRDALPRQELVAARRAEHARNETLSAPFYVGIAPPIEDRGPGDRFDGPKLESTEANVLRGTGASAGVVRGTARVVLGPEGFDRILPGDVIVCPASNPSWVPAFTIAGGLVTNTGGVLSHAAVVAREFGLPAVVGVAEATTKIHDGRRLEIDGTTGTVRRL